MKFSNQDKWRVLVWTLVLTMVFTIVAIVPANAAPPNVPPAQATIPAGASRFGSVQLDGNLYFMGTNGKLVSGPGNFSIRNYNDTQDNLQVGPTGNVALPSGATLSIGTDAFSGIVRYGTASTVISGTTIAHGFTVTPTSFIIQPATGYAGTFTQTLYANACGAISCTVGISQGSVVTFTTVQWMAGK